MTKNPAVIRRRILEELKSGDGLPFDFFFDLASEAFGMVDDSLVTSVLDSLVLCGDLALEAGLYFHVAARRARERAQELADIAAAEEFADDVIARKRLAGQWWDEAEDPKRR